MGQYFIIHPDNPQLRLIRQASEIIQKGGVIAYPTDTTYALACEIGNKSALDRICRIRDLDTKHNFTLVCRDMADLGAYAHFSTPAFRLMKAHTPGPYTFILRASRDVPKRLMHPRKKTIGVRIPDHAITQALLNELGEPIFTTTLILPDETDPLTDPSFIRDHLEEETELIIDGGYGGLTPTTVIDLTSDQPDVIRSGAGSEEAFQI